MIDPQTYNLNGIPRWVPQAALNYLAHTECGLPIRALARSKDCHASTILRQVRRFESRRDDPLVDAALRRLSHLMPDRQGASQSRESAFMTAHATGFDQDLPDEHHMARESCRILRRLCESGAVLAVARDMDKAVVVRDGVDGTSNRTAVVDQPIAQAMALQEWISTDDPSARIARYSISAAGRAALKKLMADEENKAQGLGDAMAQNPDRGADAASRDASTAADMQRLRSNLTESPLAGLARRKDKDGKPFLNRSLVAAGERLREDFELAQMGPRVTQDWDRFLTSGSDSGSGQGGRTEGSSASAAKERVGAALADLGPGLGDVALRCCCFLEGMESTEKRMGWSARSGKIVLRIALQRLKLHYEQQGKFAPRIG